jgi:hypothetical protein
MLTRNQGVYKEGQYSEKSYGKQLNALARKPRRRKFRHKKRDLSGLIRSLNFNIFDSLKLKRTEGLIVSFKIEISFEMMNYLVERFGLKHRYNPNENFFNGLKFIKERQIEKKCKTVVDSTDFLVKVMKKSDAFHGKIKVFGPCYLFIRFSKLIQVESHFA